MVEIGVSKIDIRKLSGESSGNINSEVYCTMYRYTKVYGINTANQYILIAERSNKSRNIPLRRLCCWRYIGRVSRIIVG